jgi:hypothetical protein
MKFRCKRNSPDHLTRFRSQATLDCSRGTSPIKKSGIVHSGSREVADLRYQVKNL